MSHVSGNVRWFMRHRSLKEQAVAKGDAFIRQLVIDAYSQPHYATPSEYSGHPSTTASRLSMPNCARCRAS